jgi:hypothetical protein
LTQGEELTGLANETFRDMGIENIHCATTQAVSDVKNALKSLPQIDFALLNTHQDRQLLLDIFQACLEKKQARSVFVLKHIHSSKNMEAVWKTAKNHPDVTVSMDLLSFGILLFRPDLEGVPTSFVNRLS